MHGVKTYGINRKEALTGDWEELNKYIYRYRLLSNHVCLQPFFPKFQFLYCLLSSLSPNLSLLFAGKCISNTFSDCRSTDCTSFVSSNSYIEFYREIQRKVDYCSRVKLIRLSFITQFKIEFLLPLTGIYIWYICN